MTARRPIQRPGRRNAVVAAVVLVAALGAWTWGLRIFSTMIPSDPSHDSRHTDAVVVLTGGSGRLEEGISLLRAGLADRLFVSGVYDGIDVRFLLETVLDSAANLEDRVEIGNASNTLGNAEETAVWIHSKGYTSLRLVTAAYHMPRSLLEFHGLLSDIEIVPNPVFPANVKADWWHWPGSAVLVIKEYNKYILAWIRLHALTLIGVFPSDG